MNTQVARIDPSEDAQVSTDQVSAFLSAVYGWMAVGLTITAATAWYVAGSSAMIHAFTTHWAMYWALILAQFSIVLVISARVQKLAPSTAGALFIVYSVLTGVTLAFLILSYTGESIATTFVVTASMFGATAAYGTMTKRDLAGFGQFLFMGLIGLVVASIVAIFWRNDAFQFVLSVIGVIVFTGLVAYDSQRLKLMALASADRQSSYAIVGALALYLDFLNLFLFLLRFLGNRRD